MTAPQPVLELQSVRKVYGQGDAAVHVLKDIDLCVNEGEYVAITGPSGSGKSTILNILGCLDRPTKGACRIAGEDMAIMDDKSLSRIRNTRIGFIFQSFHLVSHLTVLENVELPLFYARVGRAERREKCRQLLDRVGLGHRLTHIPNQLSGGERQRVAVARALSNDPALVLADEPTGNLDSKTSKEIMELLYELHDNGRTIVLITHDPSIAARAPRRVMLRDGNIESDVTDGGTREDAPAPAAAGATAAGSPASAIDAPAGAEAGPS